MKSSIIITLLTVGGVLLAVPILLDALFLSHIDEMRGLTGLTSHTKLYNYFLAWGIFTHLVCWITGVVLLCVGIRSAQP